MDLGLTAKFGLTTAIAERLYFNSPALEFTATVTDIRLVAVESGETGEKTQLWQVALDRTAFYPESGGQPWDMGVLIATARSGATLEVPVERVEEDEAGEVWHFVRKPLVEGTAVVGRVDAERRRDHMQQHSGQHLLSAVFLKELGARTVSFHLGAQASTIDLALAEGLQGFTPEQMEVVEAEVNRLIFADRPLTPRWHTREEAEAMLAEGRLRKLPERAGPMRVVEMQGVEFNACGGTHVTATGAIGGLLLRRVEKVKAGWRVEFVCGLRAVRAARRDFALLTKSAALMSVGMVDLPDRIDALIAGSKKAGKERQALLQELAKAEAYALDAQAVKGAVIEAAYTNRHPTFAKQLALGLAARGRGAVLSVEVEEEGVVILLSPPNARFDAGEVIKNFLAEVSPDLAMRGGGTAAMAQIQMTGQKVGIAAFVRENLADVVKKLLA